MGFSSSGNSSLVRRKTLLKSASFTGAVSRGNPQETTGFHHPFGARFRVNLQKVSGKSGRFFKQSKHVKTDSSKTSPKKASLRLLLIACRKLLFNASLLVVSMFRPFHWDQHPKYDGNRKHGPVWKECERGANSLCFDIPLSLYGSKIGQRWLTSGWHGVPYFQTDHDKPRCFHKCWGQRNSPATCAQGSVWEILIDKNAKD